MNPTLREMSMCQKLTWCPYCRVNAEVSGKGHVDPCPITLEGKFRDFAIVDYDAGFEDAEEQRIDCVRSNVYYLFGYLSRIRENATT